jgi:CheY-like chemotaxis protein
VEIDPGLFQHAMMNLLTNARDAMPGGGEVTIETRQIETDAAFLGRHPDAGFGQYVVVVVKDNGCGMDEAMQSRIFEVFFTTKKGGRCAGLGLAMVHGFVKQSGGQIEVESRIGCGSTLKLYFPACAPRPALHGDLDAATHSAVAKPGRTVLTVEDEQPIRELIARMLRGGGHTVFEAASAEEALSMLERSGGGIDLLITDVVMTGLSGFQLARRVREDHPDLPILFLSGYPESDLHRRGMMVKRAELLTKPCSQEQLLEKVEQMLAAADKTKG